ncbi:MAG: tripartite tricarboxylate transporter substrate binding protein [Burkholderiales bacterium]|nr:tripartite tricarboxylate transporter substrate binding protein [Burkholderiales bacterium]
MRLTGRYLGAFGAAILMLASGGALADYPNRPITFIVPWGAGGGTDAVGRMLATLMERDLGKPVNVMNRTGGNGVVGHAAIVGARPDGYTIGLITSEIGMMHHQGLTRISGASFTPLGLVNIDPAAIQVRADAPYKSLGELLAAVRAQPGKLKASGTGHGGSWHLSLYGLLLEQKIDPSTVPFVPSASNAAGLLDLVADGVQIIPGSHPEARALMEAGKVRSLAIMADKPSALFPQVPTVKQAVGSTWISGVWRGVAAPRKLPRDVEARLRMAVKKAYESQEFQTFMKERGFGSQWMEPEAFAQFMAREDAQLGKLMKTVGLAK